MSAASKGSMQTLYSGSNLKVVTADLDRHRVLMTFTHWAKGPPRAPVNPTLASVAGMGFVGFVAMQNHWWQTTELEEAIRVVAQALPSGADVTTFGSSMGGAGALLAAQFLPVQRVLAVAPPIIVDTSHAPWEQRFQQVADLTRCIYPLMPNLDPGTKTYVMYDPFYQQDVQHLAFLDAASRKYERWPVPFSSHTPILEIQKSGLYRDLTTAFFIRSDPASARNIVREARWKRGLIQLKYAERKLFGRARYHKSGYLSYLTSLLKNHGPQIELYEERGLTRMRLGDLEGAPLDFRACVKMEDRKRYQKNVERVMAAMSGKEVLPASS